MQTLMKKNITTPVGKLVAVFSDTELHYLLFDNEVSDYFNESEFQKVSSHPVAEQLQKELNEYFSGKRKEFNVPLNMKGTEFQKKAWKTLQSIPFGKTISYSEQAKKMKSNAVRAVGSANSRNPICILVPCHRVTRSTGEIGGYAGGVKIKEKLLALESSRSTP